MKIAVILASARSDGNTSILTRSITSSIDADLIDLNQYNILRYTYTGKYNDDFLILMKRIIENYDTLIFATPVYWYAMSGVLKIFFDRFTDLITFHKDLGRKLEGKDAFVITTSSGDHLGDQFWLPFRRTFEYLSMNFKGGCHFKEQYTFHKEVNKFLKENNLNVK